MNVLSHFRVTLCFHANNIAIELKKKKKKENVQCVDFVVDFE